MKRAIRDEWVRRLRSGEYKQGRGGLRSQSDEFCCLGVLCDMGEKQDWQKDDILGWLYGTQRGMPGEDVLQAAGLSGSHARMLASRNDYGHTFDKLADWIEDHVSVEDDE